jgi:hypothetical protein
MPSTFTPSLRLELQASGENDASWGDKTNTNFSAVLEPAIAGAAFVQMTDADYILSVGFGASDEARCAAVIVSGNNTAARNVVCPAATKLYVVRNLTSGGFPIVFKTASGTGVTVDNGETVSVLCDGSKVVSAHDPIDRTVTPDKISQTVSHAWRFNGAIGLGRTPVYEVNYSSFALEGVTGSYIPFYVSGVNIGTVNATASGLDIFTLSKPITFTTSGTVRLTIASNGAISTAGALTAGTTLAAAESITAGTTVAAGTTVTAGTGMISKSDGDALLVQDTAGAAKGKVLWTADGWGLTNQAGTLWALRVNTATNNVTAPGNFTCEGTLSGAVLTQTSDETMKTNWRSLPVDIIARVANIGKAGVFDWKIGGDASVGVGAQSLEEFLPQAVHHSYDGRKSVNSGGAAMAILVEVCKELLALRGQR